MSDLDAVLELAAFLLAWVVAVDPGKLALGTLGAGLAWRVVRRFRLTKKATFPLTRALLKNCLVATVAKPGAKLPLACRAYLYGVLLGIPALALDLAILPLCALAGVRVRPRPASREALLEIVADGMHGSFVRVEEVDSLRKRLEVTGVAIAALQDALQSQGRVLGDAVATLRGDPVAGGPTRRDKLVAERLAALEAADAGRMSAREKDAAIETRFGRIERWTGCQAGGLPRSLADRVLAIETDNGDLQRMYADEAMDVLRERLTTLEAWHEHSENFRGPFAWVTGWSDNTDEVLAAGTEAERQAALARRRGPDRYDADQLATEVRRFSDALDREVARGGAVEPAPSPGSGDRGGAAPPPSPGEAVAFLSEFDRRFAVLVPDVHLSGRERQIAALEAWVTQGPVGAAALLAWLDAGLVPLTGSAAIPLPPEERRARLLVIERRAAGGISASDAQTPYRCMMLFRRDGRPAALKAPTVAEIREAAGG